MSYKKHRTLGRPIKFKTWLALWMDMRGFSIDSFARALCYSESQVKRWRAGGVMGRHAAQLIGARYPDCPIDLMGGRVRKLSDPLPIKSRTPVLYKHLFKKMGLIPENTPIWPIALERARGIKV